MTYNRRGLPTSLCRATPDLLLARLVTIYFDRLHDTWRQWMLRRDDVRRAERHPLGTREPVTANAGRA